MLPLVALPTVVVPTVKPEAGAAHFNPSVQVESAVRTNPLAPTGKATGVVAAVPVIMEPLAVIQAQGIAAAARSYAALTAVLDAIVVEDVSAVESESFDCNPKGVTAIVASVPAWVSIAVANRTIPATVVDAAGAS
jgi:hypothetical protein